jgi:hypothetical protein
MRAPYQAIQVIAVDDGRVVFDSNDCVASKRCESLTEALTQSAIISTVKWRARPCEAAQTLPNVKYAKKAEQTELVPEGALFAPMLADTKQPQLAIHYQAHETRCLISMPPQPRSAPICPW